MLNESRFREFNVLCLPIAEIEGHSYRANGDLHVPMLRESHIFKPYTDNELPLENDAEFEASLNIEETPDLMYTCYIRFPKTFIPRLIGVNGLVKKRLENKSNAKIKFPQKRGLTEIKCWSKEGLLIACRELVRRAEEIRNQYDITHFISLPLITDEIKKNFTEFKDAILADKSIADLEECLFQNVNKLHLTIGVSVLVDETETDLASEILDSFKKDVLQNLIDRENPLAIVVKGLDYMNDDPTSVNVLYAKASVRNHEDPDILQTLGNEIVKYFRDRGIMRETPYPVKLHVTLINTRYRHERTDIDEKVRFARSRRQSFDASKIMEKYGNYYFGEALVKEIHLSHRYTEKNGYYYPTHIITCM